MDKYIELLGAEQTSVILEFFKTIENGTYNKNKTLTVQLKHLQHPITLRCIRADMQSFVNTFIDPYLEKKAYMEDARFVIDAGANIGFTAVLYANWWPNATIVCIEPDGENAALTKENIRPYKNVHLIQAGIWHSDAHLRIEAGQEDGFVVREVKGETVRDENSTTGISIDAIMKQFNATQIDFLKMNVEGSEKEVFSKNYANWLPNTTAMLVELHDGKNAGCAKAVFNTTNQYDFAVAETMPYGVLFVKEKPYRTWYASWYRENIYKPNISKERFPQFYLDVE
jgi:FkbM family methyltransferase